MELKFEETRTKDSAFSYKFDFFEPGACVILIKMKSTSFACYSLFEQHLYPSLHLSQRVITLVVCDDLVYLFFPLDCKLHEEKISLSFSPIYAQHLAQEVAQESVSHYTYHPGNSTFKGLYKFLL